jgi:hypothetical protein
VKENTSLHLKETYLNGIVRGPMHPIGITTRRLKNWHWRATRVLVRVSCLNDYNSGFRISPPFSEPYTSSSCGTSLSFISQSWRCTGAVQPRTTATAAAAPVAGSARWRAVAIGNCGGSGWGMTNSRLHESDSRECLLCKMMSRNIDFQDASSSSCFFFFFNQVLSST